MNAKATLILAATLSLSLTGCSTTKPKPFQYKEWHNVQINEHGQKCTYTMPEKTEFEQKFSDGFDDIVGGVLRATLNEQRNCKTLTQWRAVEQQAAAMAGLFGAISSLKSIQPAPSSFNANLPPSDYGLSSWNSTSPSVNTKTPTWNTVPSTGYKSSYGNTYQYDLSNPLDRIKYNTDPAAKLRDRITPNPYKDIESNVLQQGGGIYPKDNSIKWEPVR